MQNKSTIVLCTAVTAMFFLFIASIGHLSPVNDHIFLRTIFDGYTFAGYFNRQLGRLMPLVSMEYVLATKILPPSVTLLFVIQAMKMALTSVVLLRCLLTIGAMPLIAIAAWATTFFSIGFGLSSTTLQASEVNQLLFASVFVLIMLLREQGQLSRAPRLMVAIGSALLVLTFLYKEVAFSMALVFGVLECVRHRVHGQPMPKYAFALIGAALLYLAFYVTWRGEVGLGGYAQAHAISRAAVVSMFIWSDPVIVFVGVPFAIARVLLVTTRRSAFSIFDSFLLTGLAYAATFVVLALYAPYYFLPAYAFVLCGIVGLTTGRILKPVIVAACLLLTANNIPVFLSNAISARNIDQNYATFTEAMSQWIWTHPTKEGSPRKLILAGSNANQQVEILKSMGRFLEYTGLPASSFLIEADQTAKPGDVLVYNPFQSTMKLPPLGTPSSQTILITADSHAAPQWSVLQWAQTCLGVPNGCGVQIAGNSPYTGYAAFVKERDETVASPQPLHKPSYEVGPIALPDRMRAGTDEWIDVSVMNTGHDAWPVAPDDRTGAYVRMSYAWLDQNGNPILYGDRVNFPATMMPGDTARVRMLVHVPQNCGQYTLALTPVQEGISWFYQGEPNAPGAKKKIGVFQTFFARVAHRVSALF